MRNYASALNAEATPTPGPGSRSTFWLSVDDALLCKLKHAGWYDLAVDDAGRPVVDETAHRLVKNELLELGLDHKVPAKEEDNVYANTDPSPVEPDARPADPLDGDQLADKLEAQELDAKRPLCEVTKRKGGFDKLATHRVWRNDGTVELTCLEEIGPASTWLRMEELR